MAKLVLDPDKIVATIVHLHDRIQERFPNSGLSAVCIHLKDIGANAKDRAEWIGRPIYWLRLLVFLGWAVILALAVYGTWMIFKPLVKGGRIGDVVLSQLDVEINIMILVGGTMFFLWSLENRYKRWRALQAIHELRSVAHVIDMHQLTKDPDRMLADSQPTSASPTFTMSRYELGRYLDYCSEMLSLTGKIAALYVQKFDDPVALAAASEVESTTTGLSGKIWQKLSILNTIKSQRL